MRTAEVIEYFGGVKQVADALDIWPQAVYQWGDIVPESSAYKIEVITNGALKVMESDYESGIRNTFHYDNPDIPCVNCHMGNEDVNRNPTK